MFTAKDIKAIVSKMKDPVYIQLNGRQYLCDAKSVFSSEYVSTVADFDDNEIQIGKSDLVRSLSFMNDDDDFVVRGGQVGGMPCDVSYIGHFRTHDSVSHTLAFELSKKDLSALVKNVAAFTSTDVYRPNMNAAMFSDGNVYATNGHYMMTKPFTVKNNTPRFYISKSALVLADKISSKNDTIQVFVNLDEIEGSRSVSIKINNKTIYSQEEGHFPAAERLIDKSVSGISFTATKSIADYIKVGSKHYNSMDLTIECGQVTIAFSDEKKSTNADTINGGRFGFKSFTTSTKGFESFGRDRMSVILNPSYVTKLLTALGADATILLKYCDSNQYTIPVNLVQNGGQEKWAVLMPISGEVFDYRNAV